MSGGESVPAGLRERVNADLRPVRPLAAPWRRALLVTPLAVVLVAAVHERYGTRHDLGPMLLWGASVLQIALGTILAAAALREVLPDRPMSSRARALLFVAGFSLAIVVTYLAWHASGTVAPEAKRYPYWKACFRNTIEVGTPVLLVIMVLAARGVMWRPGLVGGLAGLAAGLIADATWRTFCDVAEPAHVLSSHMAGIVLLAIAGAAIAKAYAWLAKAE